MIFYKSKYFKCQKFFAKFLTRRSSTAVLKAPEVTFNNGQKCPILGLGFWRAKPKDVPEAVKHALRVGYRHFDCASLYQNEKDVGQALKDVFAEGTIKREEVFMTSKLWCTMNRPAIVERAITATLKDLQLDYLDLYLMHWPFSLKEGRGNFPKDNTNKEEVEGTAVDYVETWKAMEDLQKKSFVKSIGISNFNKRQIKRLLGSCTIIPVVNQVECHIYYDQQKLQDYCKSKNIHLAGYSALGSEGRPKAKPSDPKILTNSVVDKIAKKHGKTPAQICLKYNTQREIITLVKSTNKARIESNFQIWDFHLDEEDMLRLRQLDIGYRYYPFLEASKLQEYPFKDEYGK